jgi:hypothetical protein
MRRGGPDHLITSPKPPATCRPPASHLPATCHQPQATRLPQPQLQPPSLPLAQCPGMPGRASSPSASIISFPRTLIPLRISSQHSFHSRPTSPFSHRHQTPSTHPETHTIHGIASLCTHIFTVVRVQTPPRPPTTPTRVDPQHCPGHHRKHPPIAIHFHGPSFPHMSPSISIRSYPAASHHPP